MEISVDEFLAEVDREYEGLTLSNGDGSRITLRSAVRLGNDTLGRMDAAQSELSRIQESETADYNRVTALLVDVLALAADRPDALRSLVDGWDIGRLQSLTAKWQKATQGEAPAQ